MCHIICQYRLFFSFQSTATPAVSTEAEAAAPVMSFSQKVRTYAQCLLVMSCCFLLQVVLDNVRCRLSILNSFLVSFQPTEPSPTPLQPVSDDVPPLTSSEVRRTTFLTTVANFLKVLY